MNEAEAREILGDTIQDDGGLYNLGHYIGWRVGDDTVVLDCEFSADELEAIVFWMRRKQP